MSDEELEILYQQEQDRLRKYDPKKHPPNPWLKEPWEQVDWTELIDLMEAFDGMLGYPKLPRSLQAKCEELAAMCGTRDRAEWLIKFALAGAERCPTPIEFRRMLDSRGKCADGVSPEEADRSQFMGDGRS